MRTPVICGLVATTLMLSFSPDADARPFRPGLLPNGDVNTCANCHVSPAGGGPRTAFGEDVRANVSVGGTEFFWADVCMVDSDGDGLTNGQELGDPCCLWDDTDDTFLRDADISLPGDMASMTADPNGPDEDGDGISNACDPDYVPPSMDMGMPVDMGDTDMGNNTANNMPNNTTNNTPNNTANNTPNNTANNTPGNNDSPDMGTGAGGDMGADMMMDDDGGCGCTAAPGTTATPWLLALAFVFGRLRRRRS